MTKMAKKPNKTDYDEACVGRILHKKGVKGRKPTPQELAIAISECKKGGKKK